MPKLRKGLNTKWKLTLPTHMAGKIELILMDRMTGKPIYGARSELIRRLLEQWLQGGAPIDELPPDPGTDDALEGAPPNG